MRKAHTYRAGRKLIAKAQGVDRSTMAWDCDPKVGPGRQTKWLMRHPKLAPFFPMAMRLLGGGAKWKALRKMMVVLAQSPKIKPLGGDFAVPAVALLPAHQRGSWRRYPHVVIDANLQVQP